MQYYALGVDIRKFYFLRELIMEIPATAKEIIESITQDYGYSVRELAVKIKLGRKTLYSCLKGNAISNKANAKLITYYIRVKYLQSKTAHQVTWQWSYASVDMLARN
jgi:hypothetical protein